LGIAHNREAAMAAVQSKGRKVEARTLRVEVTAREGVLPCPVCRARGVGVTDGSNVHLAGALHRPREYPLIPRGAIDHDFPDVFVSCRCDEGHAFELNIATRRGGTHLFATWIDGDEEGDSEERLRKRLAHAAAAAGPQEARKGSEAAYCASPREPQPDMMEAYLGGSREPQLAGEAGGAHPDEPEPSPRITKA